MTDGGGRPPGSGAPDVVPIMHRLVEALPAGEPRPGQIDMATAVADAVATESHLVVQALPFLHDHLGLPFTAALLKGRSNYLCRAALADAVGGTAQDTLAAEG